MLKNKIMEQILVKDKLSFIEIILINQPNEKCLNNHLNKKGYFNFQNNIKHLIKTNPKKIVSKIKIFNN